MKQFDISNHLRVWIGAVAFVLFIVAVSIFYDRPQNSEQYDSGDAATGTATVAPRVSTSNPSSAVSPNPTRDTSREPQPSETAQTSPTVSSVTSADIDYPRARALLIPVAGVKASQLRDTFADTRSESRPHQALDIAAPLGTSVLATTDGEILKLYQSERGGITLYQLDPSGRYVYYYAHLSGYAPGIAEGTVVRKGQEVAYVGDTGNAGAGNPHLHFAISKLTSPRRWSGGDPINPYPLLANR